MHAPISVSDCPAMISYPPNQFLRLQKFVCQFFIPLSDCNYCNSKYSAYISKDSSWQVLQKLKTKMDFLLFHCTKCVTFI